MNNSGDPTIWIDLEEPERLDLVMYFADISIIDRKLDDACKTKTSQN